MGSRLVQRAPRGERIGEVPLKVVNCIDHDSDVADRAVGSRTRGEVDQLPQRASDRAASPLQRPKRIRRTRALLEALPGVVLAATRSCLALHVVRSRLEIMFAAQSAAPKSMPCFLSAWTDADALNCPPLKTHFSGLFGGAR